MGKLEVARKEGEQMVMGKLCRVRAGSGNTPMRAAERAADSASKGTESQAIGMT